MKTPVAAGGSPYPVSRLTITFTWHEPPYPGAIGHLVPSVEFDPVGRIHASTIEANLGWLYREIARAQTAQRTQRAPVADDAGPIGGDLFSQETQL